MRLNEHTVIEGQRVLLIPYEEHHVEKYHNWMKSPELQTLTASEPLSLDEEYKMQKSWREDADIKYNQTCSLPFIQVQWEPKLIVSDFTECTFIVLCKEKFEETKNDIEAMVGDTNIFLKNEIESAEVEIMIAEKSSRGKGLGKEAVLLMIRYGIVHLKVKTFQAIILADNQKSISLFEALDFKKVNENKIFNEIIFEKEVTSAWTEWVKSKTETYNEKLISQLHSFTENL